MDLDRLTIELGRTLTLFGLVALVGCQINPDDAPVVWYVQSAASPNAAPGIGTREAPFRSLATVSAAAGAGHEIHVLAREPGAPILDGGIVLRDSQVLRAADGEGPRPVLTNTDPDHHGGDAVTLANGSVVDGITISGAAGHAVVGRNVQGALVRHTRITGGNLAGLTSVTTGATAGLGVAAFPKAVVAFLHDGPARERGQPDPNKLTGNTISGLEAGEVRLGGAGIALHARGGARGALVVTGNRISDLGAGFARSGVLVDTQDTAAVQLDIEDTSVTNAFESSDGILIVAQHRSSLAANIRRYRYVGGTDGQGIGNNGLEVVTYFGASWLDAGPNPERHTARSRVVLEESDITGTAGFGVAVWNIFGKPSDATVLDFGGGELGGRGGNRFWGNGLDLPVPMDIYVVHDDLNAPNNWWGKGPSGAARVVRENGTLRLADEHSFACPGRPGQLDALIEGTGVGAWAMFCQAYRDDVCTSDAPEGDCCNPTTDAARCIAAPEPSSVSTAPALAEDPRP